MGLAEEAVEDLEEEVQVEDGKEQGIREKQRSVIPSLFLSKHEKNIVVKAIEEAEKNTSGEIRVHLEMFSKADIIECAKKIFEKLWMTKTASRNGVLILVSIKNKKFAILGDKGINEKVPEDFWHDVSSVMEKHFKENHFAEGLSNGIKMVGEKLKEYFPYTKDDVNELPNDISF